MPVAPRVTRGAPRGDRIDYPDPVPVLVVLRWQGRGAGAVELVPGHKIAETRDGGRVAALVRWTFAPAGKGSERIEEDWFRGSDVLGHQPDAEEWAEIVARPVWAG